MARKTIDVSRVRDLANKALNDSVDEVQQGRTAIAVFLENILMETGNYKGFRYTDGANGKTDDTRRHYH